MCKTKQ